MTPTSASVYVKLPDGSRGPRISKGFTRIVVGGRGTYVEMVSVHRKAVEVQPGEEYRLTDEWVTKVFYAWYRTVEGHRKLYFQYKPVDYADYKVGMWYVFIKDVILEYDE